MSLGSTTATGGLWSKVKGVALAVLIGADLVATAMLVWHERHVQYVEDSAQIEAARTALNTQLQDEATRVDALNAELDAMRQHGVTAVEGAPAVIACKGTANIAADINAAFTGK